MNQEQIKQIIPHRDPFLFIDEIIELETLKRAVGIKYVKEDEYYFQGHFPGQAVMPGVLIVEALAQVGAVTLLSHPEYKGKIALFTGISNAKFRKSVFPGDTLKLECELKRFKKPFGFGNAKAYVDNQLVCEVELSFAIG